MEQTPAAENAEYVSARLWRNWYRSRVDHQTTEGPRRAGEEWAGEGVYATEREAEEAALFVIELRRELNGPDFIENAAYLGARPDL